MSGPEEDVGTWIRDGGAITIDTLTLSTTESAVRLTCKCGAVREWNILDVLREDQLRQHVENLLAFYTDHQHADDVTTDGEIL